MAIWFRRGARGLLLATAVLLPLTGCGREDPIAADEAVPHYDAVAEDVTGALGSTNTRWELGGSARHVREKDSVCRYNPGQWTPDPALTVSDDADWDAWIAALNPVLVEDGFQKFHKVDQAEYSQILRTHDDHGAQIEITADGTVRIWDAVVDASPCTDAAVGLDTSG